MNNQPQLNHQMNINKIFQENINLKKKLQSFQEKEKLYLASISKFRKFQNEYRKTFIKTLNDYKLHEEQIKKTYINYQKLIENHYKENENRFLEENSKLTMEIKQKNNIIKNLNNKIRLLNQKLNKVENDYQFENKKLESEVVSKERRLSELNESMIQLARNTNDEIKLLRDEFEIFNNKKKRNKRFQSFQKTDYDNSFTEDDIGSNNMRVKGNFYDRRKRKNKDIDFLINQVNILERKNQNLTQKLKRKEEELQNCNKLKNELFYNINMKNNFPSFQKYNNNINLNKSKYNKLSNNYRNKKHHINMKYNIFSDKNKNEINDLNNNYEKDLNQNYNLFKEEGKNINKENILDFPNYDQFLNDYDINELIITSNQNKFHNFNKFDEDDINHEEGIRDEYINSRLPKINTLE